MLTEESRRHGVELGALIRAALTAGQITESAQSFSFGTNDLTLTTWGFSRADVERAFFFRYLERGVTPVPRSPGERWRQGTEPGAAARC